MAIILFSLLFSIRSWPESKRLVVMHSESELYFHLFHEGKAMSSELI